MTRNQTGGDCYAVAGRAAIEDPQVLYVVHATVEAPGVPRHGHAWVELADALGTVCQDRSNGNDVTLPQAVYYYFGRVEDARRYPREQALKLLVSTRHFGPWEEDPR